MDTLVQATELNKRFVNNFIKLIVNPVVMETLTAFICLLPHQKAVNKAIIMPLNKALFSNVNTLSSALLRALLTVLLIMQLANKRSLCIDAIICSLSYHMEIRLDNIIRKIL